MTSLRRMVALVVLGLCLLQATTALAKDYSIEKVAIVSQVEATGDLDVVEQRTFRFDGEFTRVFWTLRKEGGEGIEVLGVSKTSDGSTPVEYVRTDDPSSLDTRPEGYFLVQDQGSTIEVDVFHRTSDADATFTLHYRVAGAAKRYADTSELYWQYIGSEWERGTAAVDIEIKPPATLTKEQVRAWAHGPLTGVVSIGQDGIVSLKVDDVPSETFIEARILYPADALAQAPLVDRPRENQVLAEEGRLANEANRKRRSARLLVGAWTVGPALLSLAAVALGVWAFFRFGREHKAEFAGQYFREDPRPDLHPAVVGALWRFGKVEDVDIAATLMNLADKGVIRMSPSTTRKEGIAGLFGGEEQSFTLERLPAKEAKIDKLDKDLLRILFEDVAGGRTSMDLAELKPYAKANAQSFSETIKGWKESASAAAEAMGFFEAAGSGWQVGLFILAGFLVALGAFGLISTGSGFPLIVTVPAAAVLAAIAVVMKRRSRQGNELYRTYRAVRDFLKDFSRLQEAPPASVVLWNRFLVLAVVFGIAEEVIEQLRIRLPDVVKDPQFQTSYWWVYAGSYGHSPVSVVSSSFVSAASVATSQMSSASGGGGGFSGGGGFGGGGGGGGAD